MDLVIQAMGSYMLDNYPIASTLFGLLGLILTVITALDGVLPKLGLKDKMEEVMEIPIVGRVLRYMLRFSALRNKKPGEE